MSCRVAIANARTFAGDPSRICTKGSPDDGCGSACFIFRKQSNGSDKTLTDEQVDKATGRFRQALEKERGAWMRVGASRAELLCHRPELLQCRLQVLHDLRRQHTGLR